MLEQLNTWVWGSGLLVLLLGTGLFHSIRTHFFQIFGIRTIRQIVPSARRCRTMENVFRSIGSCYGNGKHCRCCSSHFRWRSRGSFLDVGIWIFGHDADLC